MSETENKRAAGEHPEPARLPIIAVRITHVICAPVADAVMLKNPFLEVVLESPPGPLVFLRHCALFQMTVTIDLAAAAHDVHVRRALYDISASVVKKKKIVVVTGAGISCSCGIPVCSTCTPHSRIQKKEPLTHYLSNRILGLQMACTTWLKSVTQTS